MDELAVPLDMLAAIAGDLDLLISEFEQSGNVVQEAHHDVGSPTVMAALTDFAGNWAVHRKELVDKIVGVRDMAEKGRQAYIDADNKLAQDIRQSIQGAQ